MKIPPEVKAEYAARRSRALREQNQRRETAFSRLPRLAEIHALRQELILRRGAALLKGGPIPELEAELGALNEEQRLILQQNGLSPAEFEPRFCCPLCQDTGFTGSTRLEPCKCLKQRLLQLSHASSRLDRAQRFEAFDESIFQDERQLKLARRTAQFCMEYGTAFPHNQTPGLMLIGQSGLGKTFLLNCVGNLVAERGHTVLKATAYNLIDDYMASMRGGERLDFMAPDLLLIDDLGTEPAINNITCEYLFTIVNERQAAGRGIAIATNLSPGHLNERYGERLFSRLVAKRLFSVIVLEGKDLRNAPAGGR